MIITTIPTPNTMLPSIRTSFAIGFVAIPIRSPSSALNICISTNAPTPVISPAMAVE